MRWFASTALCAGIALVSGAASASPNYPDTVKTYLGLTNAPQCALCHGDGKTGLGTVTTPFGKSALAEGLVNSDTSKLKSVLDLMKADAIDSDDDGVGDIDELLAKTDPNVAGGGTVEDVPQLTYGCAATLAPGRPGPSSGAVLGLGLVAALTWARRRRGNS